MMKPIYLLSILIILIVIVVAGFFSPYKYKETFNNDVVQVASVASSSTPTPFKVKHIETPDAVKALYMSSWVAGNIKLRSNLVKIIDDTELNSVVIDIKDYTGRISFPVNDEKLKEIGSATNRIPDIKEFIGLLHDKGIYVIGRISTFQDSYLVHKKPEYAVKNKAGGVWQDYKGVSWLDAGSPEVWDYVAKIGDEAYAVGFDELNFDYIRFPSDGDMTDIVYTYSEGKSRSQVLDEFFNYLDKYFHEKKIPISADLFGMTTSNRDDLGIGQILESALRHFDYVSPMVYPSHYPKNFLGFNIPAEKPYEVVFYAMTKGVERAELASTTPYKLRPWLQDFSIGKTTYNSDMVKAQIKATYDSGLNSWLLWNASNNYTVSALEPDPSLIVWQ